MAVESLAPRETPGMYGGFAYFQGEIVPFDEPVDAIAARRPAGLILSGGPASVYAEGAPLTEPALLELGIPILGICYGVQLASLLLGGQVSPAQNREYGRASVTLTQASSLMAR